MTLDPVILILIFFVSEITLTFCQNFLIYLIRVRDIRKNFINISIRFLLIKKVWVWAIGPKKTNNYRLTTTKEASKWPLPLSPATFPHAMYCRIVYCSKSKEMKARSYVKSISSPRLKDVLSTDKIDQHHPSFALKVSNGVIFAASLDFRK